MEKYLISLTLKLHKMNVRIIHPIDKEEYERRHKEILCHMAKFIRFSSEYVEALKKGLEDTFSVIQQDYLEGKIDFYNLCNKIKKDYLFCKERQTTRKYLEDDI